MNQVRKHLTLGEPDSTGRGIRVAVLDTGLDLTHPDFDERVRVGDSRSLTIVDDLDDRDGHGTHVAGIIAGSGTISSGVYRGIAPEAELIVFKIANGGRGWDSDAISAIEAAIGAGARIINYSHGMRPPESAGSPPWVWPTRRSLLETTFEEASNAGVLCVVAAGNEGPISGTVTRPGGIDCVLTVGAVDQGGVVWSGSGRGPYRRCEALRAGRAESYAPALHPGVESISKPDVVAPGVGVTAVRSRQVPPSSDAPPLPPYVEMTGTSQATAVVSGLAALMLDLCARHAIDLGTRPGKTLKQIIRHAARALRIGDRNDFGGGALVWPVLVQTLKDFATSDDFRRQVLHGPELKLLD